MKLRAREILFLLLIAGLLGCAWHFGFARMAAEQAAKAGQVRQKRAVLDHLRAATAAAGDVAKKTAELEAAIAFFEGKLPPEKEIDRVLREVWQTAEGNRLQIQAFKTLKPAGGAAFSEQPIQMRLTGGFDGFYQFLLQLETLPRITRITRMELSKIDARDGDMQADVTMSIFFEPDGGQ